MSDQRPNLLFVFADQMRGMDMGCAGNSDVITPNMDRMAANGVIAPNHYATSPVCCPNRGTILTGLAATKHRVMLNDLQMPPDLVSFGTLALYYQTIPPYYLSQRFQNLGQPNTDRLYYLVWNLQLSGSLANWKLEITSASKEL